VLPQRRHPPDRSAKAVGYSVILLIAAADAQQIPLARLAWALLPVAAVCLLLWRWGMRTRPTLWATTRMIAQLILVGYVLEWVFTTESPLLVMAIVVGMLGVASWIAVGPVAEDKWRQFAYAYLSIGLAGGTTLAIVTQAVLSISPWYAPARMIPLAGMIFASAMNSLSLAADRHRAERTAGRDEELARRTALQTALLPATNSLLAVGLVALPGMMTGQILMGTHPLIAVRYQIMVMAMVFGSQGLAAACYLALQRKPAAAS
ncbi:MAG: ABC transporter permease, partial [Planctomycetales bacterium]|nr:ABC transporter permease [Planctomycetales bacterium]